MNDKQLREKAAEAAEALRREAGCWDVEGQDGDGDGFRSTASLLEGLAARIDALSRDRAAVLREAEAFVRALADGEDARGGPGEVWYERASDKLGEHAAAVERGER